MRESNSEEGGVVGVYGCGSERGGGDDNCRGGGGNTNILGEIFIILRV